MTCDEMLDEMLKAASEPAVMTEEDLAMLVVADEMQTALTELAEAAGEIAETIDVFQCGRISLVQFNSNPWCQKLDVI